MHAAPMQAAHASVQTHMRCHAPACPIHPHTLACSLCTDPNVTGTYSLLGLCPISASWPLILLSPSTHAKRAHPTMSNHIAPRSLPTPLPTVLPMPHKPMWHVTTLWTSTCLLASLLTQRCGHPLLVLRTHNIGVCAPLCLPAGFCTCRRLHLPAFVLSGVCTWRCLHSPVFALGSICTCLLLRLPAFACAVLCGLGIAVHWPHCTSTTSFTLVGVCTCQCLALPTFELANVQAWHCLGLCSGTHTNILAVVAQVAHIILCACPHLAMVCPVVCTCCLLC
jgi:hypothetical protein